MQLDKSSHAREVSFIKKFTLKGIQYSAILDRIYERDGVMFFQSCCDLCFCENGVLNDRQWRSMSNDHIDIELQTTGDGKTVVALKSNHMNVGYLVFSVAWFPIAYMGFWFWIFFMLGAGTDGGTGSLTGMVLFFRGSAPLLVMVLLWLGYKRHCAFIESGLAKLLAALQRFPAEINLKKEDYGSMLDALPATEKGPGFFRSYATGSADSRIMLDTPMDNVFGRKEGYLFRDHEGDVDVTYVPRKTDTLLVFRASPDYPLGLLIGIFIALWISWTYFVGYKYVIHFGAGTALNQLVLAGFFIAFMLMLLTGFGILLFRKTRYDRAVKEAVSTVTNRLESNQQ